MPNPHLPQNPFEEILDPKKEEEQIKDIADRTVKLLDKRYRSKNNPILRGVHPKSHGCVRAVLQVNADIGKEYQVGLFAKPGKRYDAWIRYSNAEARPPRPDVRTKDQKEGGGLEHGSRGMAVKVLNVGGRILLDDHGAKNQDFLMITEPSFAFANVTDYQRLTQVIDENNDEAGPFFVPPPNATPEDKQRITKTLELIGGIRAKAVANPLEVPYFGAAPFLFGPDRVMKFSAQPSAGVKLQTVLENPPPSADYLREALLRTMSGDQEISFDFMVQVRGKEDALNKEDPLNIENASSPEWDKTKFPFVKVAKITIPAPQKDIDSESGVKHCENLVFTPWHSLAEHQPLGSINRLRKAVYIASETHRGAKAVPPPDAKKQPDATKQPPNR
jgi:hypothetical protein